MRRGLIRTAVVRPFRGRLRAGSVIAGASDIRFLDYLIGTAIGIMVPVVLLTVATEQTSRLLTDPSAMQLALLAGVMALWIAVAFGAQAVLERIAKGQRRRDRVSAVFIYPAIKLARHATELQSHRRYWIPASRAPDHTRGTLRICSAWMEMR